MAIGRCPRNGLISKLNTAGLLFVALNSVNDQNVGLICAMPRHSKEAIVIPTYDPYYQRRISMGTIFGLKVA